MVISRMALHSNVRSKSHRVIALLLLSATIAVGLLCVGGYVVYKNMRHAERERGWVEHSQAVLNMLQSQQARLDRVDYSALLYKASGERTRA